MAFVEGTCRLDSGAWQVSIFSRKDVNRTQWQFLTFESGISGVVIHHPKSDALNQAAIERALCEALNVQACSRIKGPDSIMLR